MVVAVGGTGDRGAAPRRCSVCCKWTGGGRAGSMWAAAEQQICYIQGSAQQTWHTLSDRERRGQRYPVCWGRGQEGVCKCVCVHVCGKVSVNMCICECVMLVCCVTIMMRL